VQQVQRVVVVSAEQCYPMPSQSAKRMHAKSTCDSYGGSHGANRRVMDSTSQRSTASGKEWPQSEKGHDDGEAPRRSEMRAGQPNTMNSTLDCNSAVILWLLTVPYPNSHNPDKNHRNTHPGSNIAESHNMLRKEGVIRHIRVRQRSGYHSPTINVSEVSNECLSLAVGKGRE